jgi:hypothetical protein
MLKYIHRNGLAKKIAPITALIHAMLTEYRYVERIVEKLNGGFLYDDLFANKILMPVCTIRAPQKADNDCYIYYYVI